MHFHLPTLLFALTPLLPQTTAWGSLGHRTVAYLSSLYFTPQSTHLTNLLLHGQDISEAALFPDKIRYIPSFAYTRAWHYIDAQDSPPYECGINVTRDCAVATGCVVSAIANHTARLADGTLPLWQRGQSLRFVLHFIGDVHQPLHTEAEDRGGNAYEVVFEGKRTNLHSVWDTLMVNRYAGLGHDDEELAAWTWAQRLYALDDDEDEGGHGLEDECIDDVADCALEWAGESNAYVCSYVLAHDVHRQDLAGEYYDGATSIIDEMVRKGGRRLAAWINAIAEDIDLEEPEHLPPNLGLQTQ